MVLLKSGKGSCSFLPDIREALTIFISGKPGTSKQLGEFHASQKQDRWHPPQAMPASPHPHPPPCPTAWQLQSDSENLQQIRPLAFSLWKIPINTQY